MRRHLNRVYKCDAINDITNIDVNELSLTKNTNKIKPEYYCNNCNKKYCNSFSYNRHINSNICKKKINPKEVF